MGSVQSVGRARRKLERHTPEPSAARSQHLSAAVSRRLIRQPKLSPPPRVHCGVATAVAAVAATDMHISPSWIQIWRFCSPAPPTYPAHCRQHGPSKRHQMYAGLYAAERLYAVVFARERTQDSHLLFFLQLVWRNKPLSYRHFQQAETALYVHSEMTPYLRVAASERERGGQQKHAHRSLSSTAVSLCRQALSAGRKVTGMLWAFSGNRTDTPGFLLVLSTDHDNRRCLLTTQARAHLPLQVLAERPSRCPC